MYESPINIITNNISTELNKKIDAMVIEKVVNVGVSVDKDELVKALQYDRNQYEKGYQDAMKECGEKVQKCLERIQNECQDIALIYNSDDGIDYTEDVGLSANRAISIIKEEMGCEE